ncbi:UNVERIFIED_CONTAM: hypothetical protein H355_004492 [Colinus virginianus]|nr:hypothetical protein H355_004492 [Colinus virginianus]
MEMDLLHPDPKVEATKHKLKRLISNPNSFFMDVKCPGCLQITTVFSHAQTVVLCGRRTRVTAHVLPLRSGMRVLQLQHHVVPADWREVQVDGGVLLPQEG